MGYETYLLETVFDGDKDQFEKTIAEERNEAVSWTALMASTETPSWVKNLKSFKPYTGLSYQLAPLTFGPFSSFFIWQNHR